MFELLEAPKIEDRKPRHFYQVMDRSGAGDSQLLRGPSNTFLVVHQNGVTFIAPQFEPELTDDLEAMVRFMEDHAGKINLCGFPADTLRSYNGLIKNFGGMNLHLALYQEPFHECTYTRKLAAFKDCEYNVRPLTEEDCDIAVDLVKKWCAKKESRFQAKAKLCVATPHDLQIAIQRLQEIGNEHDVLKDTPRNSSRMLSAMKLPLTTLYGAFRDDELLALSQIFQLGDYAAFERRFSVRTDTLSPQEFLDLHMARHLVRGGVKLFDRGVVYHRKGMISLIEYKKKFGRLIPENQEEWFNVRSTATPEGKLLNKMFYANS